MIDDATLAEWEQDIEQALCPSSLQQGAMWAGLMGSHLRAAIAEIRRLREDEERDMSDPGETPLRAALTKLQSELTRLLPGRRCVRPDHNGADGRIYGQMCGGCAFELAQEEAEFQMKPLQDALAAHQAVVRRLSGMLDEIDHHLRQFWQDEDGLHISDAGVILQKARGIPLVVAARLGGRG